MKSLRMSQKSFLDNKKKDRFSICWEGGVNQHMENSICFVVLIFESFPYRHTLVGVKSLSQLKIVHLFEKSCNCQAWLLLFSAHISKLISQGLNSETKGAELTL